MTTDFIDLSELNRMLERPKQRRKWKRRYESWKENEAGRMRLRKRDKQKRHRKQAKREVIAVDGEGVTDPDGSHRYTLMGASNGTEHWTASAHDMSTNECLQFILGLPHGPLLVGFSFRYDVAMICRDVHPDALRKLWEGKIIRTQRYAMQYIPGRVFIVEDRWLGERREVYDVFGFYQQSFVAALREWQIDCDVDEIARMKDLRGTFEDADAAEVERYCLAECVALVALFKRLRDACYAAELRPNRWWGAGALAGAMLRQHGVDKFMEGYAETETHLRAYFGGRFELRQTGEYHDVHAYDIRSAYPHIIRSLPCMAHGTFDPVTDYDPAIEHAIWRVDWNVGPQAAWTPFPFRHDGNVYYSWRGSGYYHASEVRAAVRFFGADSFGIRHGIALRLGCDCVPFGFVPEMYRYRAQLRANGDRAHYAIKLALNSLYGKTIQAIGWQDSIPKYRNVWWAGEITAGTRAMLLDATAHDPDAVFSFATDGIVSTRELPLDIGPDLGQWEYTHVARGRFYQPGIYELQSSDGTVVRKSRGFSARDVDWDALWSAYEDDPAYGRYEYQSTRFYGIGGSLARDDFEDVFRTWRTFPRQIGFEPSRRVLRTDGATWRTEPPDRPSAKLSEVYKRTALPAVESDEMMAVGLDQP